MLTTQITQMYLPDTLYFLLSCAARSVARSLFSAHILFIDRDKRHEANFNRTPNDSETLQFLHTPPTSAGPGSAQLTC